MFGIPVLFCFYLFNSFGSCAVRSVLLSEIERAPTVQIQNCYKLVSYFHLKFFLCMIFKKKNFCDPDKALGP